MEDLNVYERVENHEVPNNTNIIKSRLIFKYKRNAVGEITERKTRLVVKGFTQQYGIDYKDTFTPTLKLDSIRIFTYIAVRYNFQIEQIDVNTAYLNASLRNELYMEPPKGHPDYKHYTSGMEWNNELNKHLLIIGFRCLNNEPCIYVK